MKDEILTKEEAADKLIEVLATYFYFENQKELVKRFQNKSKGETNER